MEDKMVKVLYWNRPEVVYHRSYPDGPEIDLRAGPPMKKRLMSVDERKFTAYHELGHAAMVYWRRESLHERKIVLHSDRCGGSLFIPMWDLTESDLMLPHAGPVARLLRV